MTINAISVPVRTPINRIPGRSRELQEWIDACGTKEKIKNKLWELPDNLRLELYKEAKRDKRVQRTLDAGLSKTLKAYPSKSNDLRVIEEYCKYDNILGSFKLELAGWNCGNWPASNALSNSALFHVQVPNVPRKLYQDEVLASRSNVTIQYTGQELFQDDLDVLLCLLTISKDAVGAIHEISWAEMLRLLGLPDSGHRYVKIKKCVRRLRGAYVSVERFYPEETLQKKKKMKHPVEDLDVCNFISELHIRKGETFQFAIDPWIAQLYSNREYGLVDIKKRLSLGRNDLAKMLQCMIAGQAANIQRYKVSTLLRYSGLSCDEKHFKLYLATSLKKLIEAKIIFSYDLPRAKRGMAKEQVLVVYKKNPNKNLFVLPRQD